MSIAPSASLTGKDVIQVDGTNFTNFAKGDVCLIEFPDDLVNVEVGKDGNVIAAAMANGRRADVTLRVLLGSPNDKYLNSRRIQQLQDFGLFVTLNVKLVKRVGDGFGNLALVTYVGTFGMFKRDPDAKSNTDGEIEQSIAIYRLIFGRMIRVIV